MFDILIKTTIVKLTAVKLFMLCFDSLHLSTCVKVVSRLLNTDKDF